MTASLSFDGIWPCRRPRRRPASSSFASRSYSSVAAFASRALGALDERAHDVRLAAGRDLGAQPLVHGHALERARPDDLGRDRRAARRQLAQLGPVEVAVDEHRRGARDRRRGHDEHVGLVALAAQQLALLDAEPVLLVDHDDPRSRELARLVDQRVRADEDVDRPRAQALGDAPALGRGRAVREQLDATGRSPSSEPSSVTVSPSSELAHRELVLLGQHLGRRHERALVPALHRHEQRVRARRPSCPSRPRPGAGGASAPATRGRARSRRSPAAGRR